MELVFMWNSENSKSKKEEAEEARQSTEKSPNMMKLT
jgi:hypothetical protein